MEEELKTLQFQLMNDITYTESIVSAAKDLVVYLDLEPRFFRDLELTSVTLQELLRRISKAINPEHLKQFILSTKQVRIMATDLLDMCKEKMHSV